MRNATLVFSYFLAAAAVAQPNLFAPLPDDLINGGKIKACELTCSCPSVSGKVNRCSMYWRIKRTNNGNITREVNKDPGACSAAVESNLSSLSKHFGRSPEVSLPTKDMTSRLAALVIPPKQPLPYSRKLDAAVAVTAGDPLDRQLTLQTVRAQSLTEDARSFAVVNRTVTRWDTAKAAAHRLSVRMDLAEVALSLATPWPKLREFAPQAWNLAICQHSKPTEVAALANRIATKGDIAWTFAFAADYAELQAPFEAKVAIPGAAAPSFEMNASPFFSEAADVASEREDKSLYTLLEIREFRAAVKGLSEGVDGYVVDLVDRASKRRGELVSSFVTELAEIERVRSLGVAERAAVALLKGEVEAALVERSKLQESIDKLRAEISSSAASLRGATTRRDQRRLDRAAAQNEVEARRAAVDSASQQLQAVTLNCGGQPYESCNDAAAKKDFDRRRYEANQVVGAARAALTKAQATLLTINGDLVGDQRAILDLRARIGEMNNEYNALRGTRDVHDKALAQLRATLQAREAQLAGIAGQVSTLDKAAEEMVKVRPSS